MGAAVSGQFSASWYIWPSMAASPTPDALSRTRVSAVLACMLPMTKTSVLAITASAAMIPMTINSVAPASFRNRL